MEFDEVVVKESPGLCRCCLSEGCYKDLGSEYNWMGDTEIYADMLLECFDIGISQHAEGPNGPNRLICEVCITRLRDSCNFKKQVLDSEKRFIDMLHRGEFRSKAAAELPVMKQEAEALEVEYLDDLDFGDDGDGDDQPKTDTEPEQAQAEDITVTTLPMKRGRGRPRKSAPEKPERRAKVAKVEQPKASKAPAKGATASETQPEEDRVIQREGGQWVIKTTTDAGQWVMTPNGRGKWTVKLKPSGLKPGDVTLGISRRVPTTLPPPKKTPMKLPKNTPKITAKMREQITTVTKNVPTSMGKFNKSKLLRTENITTILESSTVIPFKYKDRFSCFYCDKIYHNVPSLRHHTLSDHTPPIVFDAQFMRNHDHTVKADVTEIICKLCSTQLEDLNSLIEHLKSEHGKHFAEDAGYGVMPYKLADDEFRCAVCDEKFEYYIKLNQHMNSHFAHFVCNVCGKGFVSKLRLKIHLRVHNTQFPCKECDAIFSTVQERTCHVNRAHDRKPLMCDMCDLPFSSYRARKEHFRSVHNFDIPTYDCPTCGRQFHIKSLMKVHFRRVHKQEKNIQCSICDVWLFDNTHLRRHMRVKHIRDRKFVCDLCGKRYIRKFEVKTHILKAHKFIWVKKT